MSAPTDQRTEAFSPRRGTPVTIGSGAVTLRPPPKYPFLLPPVEDGEIGRLGNYRVLRLLGAGGMGMVFAAEDIALRRPVALKVMNPELARDPVNGWQRFLREARALAAIKHPNLVTVYQAGQDNDTVYLAMELLQGETLEARLLRAGPLDAAEVVRIAGEVMAGLAALHGHGLIHRDIKPGNIWLESPGDRVRILDLGLVRAVDEDTQLTEAGVVVGTPAYMSPEQVRGRPTDHRTDLFSFGCVLYVLCTGRPPFDADTAMAQAAALAADDPVPAHQLNPAVPRALSGLIAQLLAKNPQGRPESADVVSERLKGVLRPVVVPPSESKRSRKNRTKAGGKSSVKRKRPPFLRRHAVKLVAGLWLILAVMLVAAFVIDRPKPATNPPNTPPAVAEVVFLSDLQPVRANGWPMDHFPPGTDGSVIVRGQRSKHGIFLHPMPPFEPPAGITYRLGAGYSRFRCEVALNDSGAVSPPPVVFVVLGDGKRLWESQDVTRQGPLQACDVDVQGVGELTIQVVAPLDPRGAHAVWVEPRLVK